MLDPSNNGFKTIYMYLSNILPPYATQHPVWFDVADDTCIVFDVVWIQGA